MTVLDLIVDGPGGYTGVEADEQWVAEDRAKRRRGAA